MILASTEASSCATTPKHYQYHYYCTPRMPQEDTVVPQSDKGSTAMMNSMPPTTTP